MTLLIHVLFWQVLYQSVPLCNLRMRFSDISYGYCDAWLTRSAYHYLHDDDICDYDCFRESLLVQ